MIVPDSSFYDVTPFDYGYSSKDEIIASMHPLLKKLIDIDVKKHIKTYQKKWPYLECKNENLSLKKEGLLFTDEIIADLFLI